MAKGLTENFQQLLHDGHVTVKKLPFESSGTAICFNSTE